MADLPVGGPVGDVLELLGAIVQVGNAVIALDKHYVVLGDIDAVRPVGRGRMHLDMVGGGSRYYAIAASRLSPIWSRKNTPPRDDAVRKIAAARAAYRA